MIELREWQKNARNNLMSTLTGGVILAGTGTGKTVVGLEFIERNPTKKFLIVVPTIVLQNQWKDEIVKTFKLATLNEIALMGGGSQDLPNKRITIAVVNSLRRINWKHPLANFDFTIFDELHRYASDENVVTIIQPNLGFKIGLTATLRRPDGKENLLVKHIGQVVYSISKDEAIAAGYICDYEVHKVECKMTFEESSQYTAIDNEAKQHMKLFNNNFKSIQSAMKLGARGSMFKYAVQAMKHIQNRKSFVVRVASKVDKTIELCSMYRDNKIIVFDELQESANKIYEGLQKLNIPCVIYHSGIKGKAKKDAIQKYVNNEVNIMISVKALDEGLDVKNTDIGIVVNGNSQERQILQRLGRILRQKEGKKAHLFMLYTPYTIDERYLAERMRIVGRREQEEDQFEN